MKYTMSMFLPEFISSLVTVPSGGHTHQAEFRRGEYSISVEQVVHPLSLIFIARRIYQLASALPLSIDEFTFIPAYALQVLRTGKKNLSPFGYRLNPAR
mmetsp:Transcript_15039/g.46707  ORF Transcript_15039/g.46707 Transcript_15039/m.46707 type:complete len:99 (-) Transcript_15039:315-611(-)